MKTNRLALALLILLPLAAGCGRMEVRRVYAMSKSIIERELASCENVKIQKRSHAEVNVLKNAARCDVGYTCTRNGASEAGTYTVWLKRVRMRWEPDRTLVSSAAE